ncbi:MAG: LLM class flavin-dependent oxidoreductase, partial [Actinobacteria bacterium]|nr:LLM class flavin-dependent oxidoreductase [Actinomycetota bacterium]
MGEPASTARPAPRREGPAPAGLSVGAALYTGQGSVAAGHGYRDAIELAVAAEASGFDVFWVSEHHGWDDGYLPSPLVVLAAVAARTERIELGVGVAVAPLHHPARLAEDVAVLDQLARGRVIMGLGIGYVDAEYELFGIDRRARAELLEAVVAALREGAPDRRPSPRTNADALRV